MPLQESFHQTLGIRGAAAPLHQDVKDRAARISSTTLRLRETRNRFTPHGQSSSLEIGDDDKVDHRQIWSRHQILHFDHAR